MIGFLPRSFVIKLEAHVKIRIEAYLHSDMNRIIIKNIIMGGSGVDKTFLECLDFERLC